MDQDQLKRSVAKVGVQLAQSLIHSGDILGIGTGSTVNYFIEELGSANLNLRGAYSSSEASAKLLQEFGVEVLDPNEFEKASLYVDGADEVAKDGSLTKGGGGALTREKIVASVSERFLCLVDGSKVVDQLGEFPLPVEVLSLGKAQVTREISQLGGHAVERTGFKTDNGNVILDVHGFKIENADELEATLNNIPGVVENGVFARNRPFLVLVSHACGVEVRGSKRELEAHRKLMRELDFCCETTLI